MRARRDAACQVVESTRGFAGCDEPASRRSGLAGAVEVGRAATRGLALGSPHLEESLPPTCDSFSCSITMCIITNIAASANTKITCDQEGRSAHTRVGWLSRGGRCWCAHDGGETVRTKRERGVRGSGGVVAGYRHAADDPLE